MSHRRQLVATPDATLTAVATFTADATAQLLGDGALQAVATVTPDGAVDLLGEASLQAVATFTAEGDTAVVLEGEALLQGVAHMGFDPDVIVRPTTWFRSGHGMLFPGENPRRVQGANETEGRRIPVGER